MAVSFSSILAAILAEIPDLATLEAEIAQEFQAIAHGEGGAAKVSTALAGAAVIAATAAKVAGTVQAVATPAAAE